MLELPPSARTSEFLWREGLASTLVEPRGLPEGHRWASLCGYDGKDGVCFQKHVSFKRISVSKLQESADALPGSLSAYTYVKIGSRH